MLKTKKLKLVLTILVLINIITLFSTHAFAFSDQLNYDGYYRCTASSGLNIRSSDSSSSTVTSSIKYKEIVKYIKSGDTETISGITAHWVYIEKVNGVKGWTFAGYLKYLDKFNISSSRIYLNCHGLTNYYTFNSFSSSTSSTYNDGPSLKNRLVSNNYSVINSYPYGYSGTFKPGDILLFNSNYDHSATVVGVYSGYLYLLEKDGTGGQIYVNKYPNPSGAFYYQGMNDSTIYGYYYRVYRK